MRRISPQDLSTMEYLWRQYAATPRTLAFCARSRAEWRVWGRTLRAKLSESLGGFPAERGDLDARVVEVREHREYRQEKVYFYSEPGVAVPCYVLIPKHTAPPYRPVIALHGHGSDGARLLMGQARGRAELAEMKKLNYDYARQLVQHGFMVFVPVLRSLGESLEPRREYRVGEGLWAKSCEITAHAALLLGRTLLGMRVWDVMRTIDYVHSRDRKSVV